MLQRTPSFRRTHFHTETASTLVKLDLTVSRPAWLTRSSLWFRIGRSRRNDALRHGRVLVGDRKHDNGRHLWAKQQEGSCSLRRRYDWLGERAATPAPAGRP